MFGRKKRDLQNMTPDEMDALLSKVIQRMIIKNILWILIVIGMLFWMPVVGVVLVIITAIKYFYDYYDVDSQNNYLGFMRMSKDKRDKERTQ